MTGWQGNIEKPGHVEYFAETTHTKGFLHFLWPHIIRISLSLALPSASWSQDVAAIFGLIC